ncbi:S9 family peptidase [Roseomonas sp. AR75]|uniref:alpha/beta hydrolase family protein n=1 Tax=Roseomonas sp. AR75 TaxID=2562311 RepID=UPI0010BF9E30|nr:alpha/beta fold hydrolase [Roseomonas sp. AR75]
MGLFFHDALQDEFACWALGYTASGGIDVGLLAAVGRQVGKGDSAAYWQAWMAAGERLRAEAAEAEAEGRRRAASAAYLQAACAYGLSYHPLYGAPVDPRLLQAFRAQMAALDRGLALLPEPAIPLRIPYEDTTLPAWLLPAAGRTAEVRPLVILTNGYDATVADLYFSSAVAIARHGYNCLFFDGPGQGEVLYEQAIPIRPDWEAVIRPVLDFALELRRVDRSRIALWGWSLGGYLALRGASGEDRLAACVADPGLGALLAPELLAGLPGRIAAAATQGSAAEAGLEALTRTSPGMHWKFVQRGFWVHGVSSFAAYVASARQFTLDGREALIRCPTLLTAAEEDKLSAGAPALLDRLRCPATLLRFTAAEGAGDHCEMGNRSLANRRILAWLDGVFGEAG